MLNITTVQLWAVAIMAFAFGLVVGAFLMLPERRRIMRGDP